MYKRVLVRLVSTYPPTRCGIAHYAREYVKALQGDCGFDVLDLEPDWKNPFYYIRLALRSRTPADVLHVQYEQAFFGPYTPIYYFLVRLGNHKRIITTVHEVVDIEERYAGQASYHFYRLYYGLIYRSISVFSDIVLFHTEESRRIFERYV